MRFVLEIQYNSQQLLGLQTGGAIIVNIKIGTLLARVDELLGFDQCLKQFS